MFKSILSLGLILAISACSHLPFVHPAPAPDAKNAPASGAQLAAPPVASTAQAPASTPAAGDAATASTAPSTSAPTATSSVPSSPATMDRDPTLAPPGYETANAARRTLEARSDVQTHANPQGWWIVEIPAEHTIWAFTPDDHPAHPAAVVREAVNEHGVIRIRMAVLCTASKQACDALVEEFKPLNEEMRKRLQENL